jgi:MarR family transcriptional regulator, organic hydroperoxide resistance regulator
MSRALKTVGPEYVSDIGCITILVTEQPGDVSLVKKATKSPNITGPIGLGLLLRRAHKSFSGAIAARLEKAGVTHAQFNHLRRLAENDGVSSSELSRLVEVKKATSTSILDALERKGLIRRVRDQDDRRKVNVFLTDAGWAVQKDLASCAVAVNRAASCLMTDAERMQLFDLLRRAVDALSREPKSLRDDAD